MKRETNGLIDELINEGRDELIVKVSMGTEWMKGWINE